MKKIEALFNLCLQDATIPYRWNNVVMILLHKKGDKMNLKNYRPIESSLQTTFYQNQNNKNEEQVRFIPAKRASWILFKFQNQRQNLKVLIEKSMKYNKPLVLLFVDFQKAFDTIKHNKILKALKEYRIDYRYIKIIHLSTSNNNSKITHQQ